MKINQLLISIDSIVDTRLPIISHIVPKIKEDSKMLELYLTRLSDNFRFIGFKTFRKLYETRDRNLFLKGMPTPMLEFLPIPLTEIRREMVSKEINGKIHIDLNVWPYKLLYEEKMNLAKAIQMKVSDDITVGVIEKYPDYNLYSNYGTIIDYDGLFWIERALKSGELQKNTLIGTSLITPALVINEDIFTVMKREEFLFGHMELTKKFIDLQFIEPSIFSLRMKKEEVTPS